MCCLVGVCGAHYGRRLGRGGSGVLNGAGRLAVRGLDAVLWVRVVVVVVGAPGVVYKPNGAERQIFSGFGCLRWVIVG